MMFFGQFFATFIGASLLGSALSHTDLPLLSETASMTVSSEYKMSTGTSVVRPKLMPHETFSASVVKHKLDVSELVLVHVVRPRPNETEACTMTKLQYAQMKLSPTSTVYNETHTKVYSIDCQGCSDVVTRNIGGHGPVVFVTATVTAATPTTTTVLKCIPSHSGNSSSV